MLIDVPEDCVATLAALNKVKPLAVNRKRKTSLTTHYGG